LKQQLQEPAAADRCSDGMLKELFLVRIVPEKGFGPLPDHASEVWIVVADHPAEAEAITRDLVPSDHWVETLGRFRHARLENHMVSRNAA
jgi:hypothetical protein